jgi:glutaconate CoA-transferase subunit B
VSFIGGAEIDRFGNLNTTYIGDPTRPAVRLPGSGGGCDLACLAKRVLIIMAHEPRRFVDKVSYITSPGYGDGGNWRQQMELPGGGPSAVITTLGVLRFDAATKEMYLQSTHPGVSVAEVQAATGWELRIADDLHETPVPSAAELRLLRQFDPQGFWTRA